MIVIQIMRGDSYPLNFVLYDSDGKPLNLSGYVDIKLKFKNYRSGELYVLSGSPIAGQEGKCEFDMGETFEDLVGDFKGAIEVTYFAGTTPPTVIKVVTFPNIVIKVLPDIRGE